jgi:hypothetical protein
VLADCQNHFACLLGQTLGAITYSWSHPYFLAFAFILLFGSMLLGRWQWALLLGIGVSFVALAVLFIVLTKSEEASIHLIGRVIPTVLGGVLIASAGWSSGRLLVRHRLWSRWFIRRRQSH